MPLTTHTRCLVLPVCQNVSYVCLESEPSFRTSCCFSTSFLLLFLLLCVLPLSGFRGLEPHPCPFCLSLWAHGWGRSPQSLCCGVSRGFCVPYHTSGYSTKPPLMPVLICWGNGRDPHSWIEDALTPPLHRWGNWPEQLCKHFLQSPPLIPGCGPGAGSRPWTRHAPCPGSQSGGGKLTKNYFFPYKGCPEGIQPVI